MLTWVAVPALAAALALGLVGCSFIENLTGETARKQARAEEAKQKSQVLQQKVMPLADQYVERMSQRVEQMAAGLGDPAARARVYEWRFVNATSAVQIAAGPTPVTNALDMVVMVSLSRRIVDPGWAERYGEAARPVIVASGALEHEVWRLLDGIASDEQLAELRTLLDSSNMEATGLETADFIRFDSFAGAGTGAGVKPAVRASSSLLGIVGLDPMKGIDPAIREVEQTRLLAERAVYYAQRLPILLDLQASAIGARAAAAPEVRRVTAAVDQVAQLSASLARLADDTPGLISREREAAITQFMGELKRQQDDMLALATQMRAALEAGAVTAESLDALVQSTDELLARFEREPGAPRGRPFDINEYTRAAEQIAAAANQLAQLLDSVGTQTPGLSAALDRGTTQGRALVDYFFLRVVWLIVILCAGLLGTLLLYRRRAPPVPPGAPAGGRPTRPGSAGP